MPDVLIRDVPDAELAELKAAAAAGNVSLQTYLREVVHAQASYLRRQAALAAASERLSSRAPVAQTERQAVLDAIETAHAERAEQVAAERNQ